MHSWASTMPGNGWGDISKAFLGKISLLSLGKLLKLPTTTRKDVLIR